MAGERLEWSPVAGAENNVSEWNTFDAFVKDTLENREYSSHRETISEAEAKAILDGLYIKNHEKAQREITLETRRAWGSLSFRVRTWLQSELHVKSDGKLGTETLDALVGREKGEYDGGKLTYLGEMIDKVRNGIGVGFSEVGTAIGCFVEGNINRGMVFFKGLFGLPENVQNAKCMNETMKTPAFDTVVFKGFFDSNGKPAKGTFFLTTSHKAICDIQDGKVYEPGTLGALEEVLSEDEKRNLKRIFAQAEAIQIGKNDSAIV